MVAFQRCCGPAELSARIPPARPQPPDPHWVTFRVFGLHLDGVSAAKSVFLSVTAS